MIRCIVNLRCGHLRIHDSVSGQNIRLLFNVYYDNRHIRRCLRELSRGFIVNENNEFRDWCVNNQPDLDAYFVNLYDVVDQHTPLIDRSIYVRKTDTNFYLTKGNTQLSICRDSPRRHTNQFLWFESLLEGCITVCNSITSDQEFAILEDSICLASAGDACYTIDMPFMGIVKNLLRGSVLA